MFGFRNNKWKKFKKLADSIELAKQRDYTVSWGAKVKGVFFDALAEINKPPCHYLIAIRCIESNGLVSSSQVKKFINDAERAEATIAVLASESGFEEECLDLNVEYPFIRLITLESINQNSPEALNNIFYLILNEYDFRFLMPNNEYLGLPNESGILKLFMQNAQIVGSGFSTVPEAIVNQVKTDIYKQASGVKKEFKYDFPEGTVFIHPNNGQRIPVISFIFNYQLLTAAEVEQAAVYQNSPYLIDSIIKEELLKRNSKADLSKLETGFDTTLQVKKYYYNPRLLFSYYCEEKRKGFALLVLVESQQGEQLFQDRFVISNELAKQFIEITNKDEIKRLSELYEKFRVPERNLTGRFKAFLKTLENTECIDELKLTQEQVKALKADYFFNNREIICELKSLMSDSSSKMNKVLKKYQNRPEFPYLIAGAVGLQQVLEKFPDKQKINTEIVDAITDSIEGAIESANRQIRETTQTFSLPNSGGLLIILNDLVYNLEPGLISYRIGKTLMKKYPANHPEFAGESRFPFISVVLLIHTAHYIKVHPETLSLPILATPNVLSQNKAVEDFVNELIPKWTSFEGITLLSLKDKNIMDLKFKKVNDKRARKNNE